MCLAPSDAKADAPVPFQVKGIVEVHQFKYHLKTYLAADQFHPGSIGYQVIAEELDRVLNGID
ncbi:hypothetical protein [Acetobacterium sp.]|uniref:hypothetical protein n=1 Tax=Acetobacterium sp. TaxID=1872094 RepID=UPI002F423E4D